MDPFLWCARALARISDVREFCFRDFCCPASRASCTSLCCCIYDAGVSIYLFLSFPAADLKICSSRHLCSGGPWATWRLQCDKVVLRFMLVHA